MPEPMNPAERCHECGAPEPLYRPDDVECEVCVVIDDLKNLDHELIDAMEHQEYGAARNEIEALGKTIDTASGYLEHIDDPDRHNALVGHINRAVADHNAAVNALEAPDLAEAATERTTP